MTGGAMGGLFGLIKGFQSGGIVPSSGIPGPRGGILIEAHPGERVVPAGQSTGGTTIINNYHISTPALDAKSVRHYFRYGAGRSELRKAGF